MKKMLLCLIAGFMLVTPSNVYAFEWRQVGNDFYAYENNQVYRGYITPDKYTIDGAGKYVTSENLGMSLNDLEEAIANRQTYIYIDKEKGETTEHANKKMEVVFYATGFIPGYWRTRDDGGKWKIEFDYTQDNQRDLRPLLQAKRDKIDWYVNQVKDLPTNEEKINKIIQLIIENLEYDSSNKDRNNSIYGAVLIGKTKCFGYATLFHTIMKRLGIESYVVVVETGESLLHSLNKVLYDGEMIYLDLTYADSLVNALGDRFITKVKDFTTIKNETREIFGLYQ